MKNISVFLFSLIAFSAAAQNQLLLPQPSPKAMVSHTIGITEVTVEYSAPAVRKRNVWGTLVPWGNVWRAGANDATTIFFSTGVRIGQELVPSGTYSVFVLPTDSSNFQLILNKQSRLWGTEDYDAKHDVLRVPMAVNRFPFQETLQYSISDVQATSAQLNLNWANLQLSVPIRIESHALTLNAMKDSLALAKTNDWSIYAQAVSYLLMQNTDHEQALVWVNKSISIEENFYNTWIKAKLLAQKNEFEAALELNRKAQQLGKKVKETYQTYAQEIQDAAVLWREKRFDTN